MSTVTDKTALIRTTIYGRDMRESIASGIEAIDAEVESTTAEQTALSGQFNSLVINAGSSNAEIVAGRTSTVTGLTKDTIGHRIDVVDGALAQNATQLTTKLTKADIQSLIGFLDINKNLSQIDATMLTPALLAQIAGTAGVNVTPLALSVLTTMYAEKSITGNKTNFMSIGKNLFNPVTATVGYYISETTGALLVNASYNCSDYIPILSSTSYIANGGGRLAYYDVNKVFISGIAYGGNTILNSPTNAVFIRITLVPATMNTYQLEKNTVVTNYVAFNYVLNNTVLPEKIISKDMLNAGIVDVSKTDFIITGKNLFNKATITSGYVVNEVTGAIYVSSNYSASDYIAIDPSTIYTENYGYYLAFYDVNKIFISGIGNGTSPRTITSPSNAKYIRISTNSVYVNTFQLEKGSVGTVYEQFGYMLVKGLVDKTLISDTLLVFMPSELCVAVGRTIELYNNQVAWCGNVNNYHFKWDCTIGKAMKRKFTVTGTTPLIGEYPLALTIYDNNMNIVTTATTTIKIITNVITPTKNILTIGDSLMNNKPALTELRNLSSNKYTMVGTRGTAPLKHEGRSGWSAAIYLTGASYTYESEGVNPFWDGTRFNWNYYKTQTSLSPNAVQIFLGTNGMTIDATLNASNIKQMVDYIRQDDATIPIFLVYTLYRGNQDGLGNDTGTDGYTANKGSWELEEDRKVFNLMIKINSLLNAYTNLHFVPIALCHDSEYNFGSTSTPVNPRATQTELLPVQATHPQDQGYYQMADIMFSVMAKYLNS